MPTRFVILHHTGFGCEHWDLMLEQEHALATWQLATQPVAGQVAPIRARRIGDHRKRYLDYEGAVSKDRGTVTRIDAGTAIIEDFTDSQCRFVAKGQRLAGRFSLLKTQGDDWMLRLVD